MKEAEQTSPASLRSINLDSTIDERIGQVFYTEPNGNSVTPWFLRKIERCGFESAQNRQYRVFLGRGEYQLCARMKTAPLNEAIIYHRMLQTNDALCQFVPQFFGALDQAGNQIDLEKELASSSLENLRIKYPSVYILLKDLVQETEGEENFPVVETPCDFKFARPSLVANSQEQTLHGERLPHPLYDFVRKIFFLLSGCSFAFQRRNKNLPWIIEAVLRIFSVIRTKYKLREQFERISSNELLRTIQYLKNLEEASKVSRFVFADSSLLFIPVERAGRKGLKIHLIDLAQGFDETENIFGFETMRSDRGASIRELLSLAEEIYQRTAEGFVNSPRPLEPAGEPHPPCF